MKDLEHALKRLKECALPQNNAVIRHCLGSAGLRRENSELKDQLEKTEGTE